MPFFSFCQLLSTLYISGHTDMVIDNIDFKEKSFTYGNIFDTTCKSSHTTLRMALPIPLEEKADDKKKYNIPNRSL
ncbi:hypothetical protein RhiirC2_802715 [Rhizophagus irregularis]|uniref:Uncharacterized protein n=1 Tax=Rhizophagus irregularis TaxID=588596 RepID=A0A2N1M0Z1_9GLOM|nr:hypothetical protein RhiirC2_802715 [Rhizophagus irregularis]